MTNSTLADSNRPLRLHNMCVDEVQSLFRVVRSDRPNRHNTDTFSDPTEGKASPGNGPCEVFFAAVQFMLAKRHVFFCGMQRTCGCGHHGDYGRPTLLIVDYLCSTVFSLVTKVNDLAEIVREIDSFTKAGLRVPVAVWEKYDRVNKRHKKHEEMAAAAAEVRTKANGKRGVRPEQDQDEGPDKSQQPDKYGRSADKRELDRMDESEVTERTDTVSRQSVALTNGDPASPPSTRKDDIGPFPQPSSLRQRPKRLEATTRAPFQGAGRCTFGGGRGDAEGDALEVLERRATEVQIARSGGGPSSSWPPLERAKLNELCESKVDVGNVSVGSSITFCCCCIATMYVSIGIFSR